MVDHLTLSALKRNSSQEIRSLSSAAHPLRPQSQQSLLGRVRSSSQGRSIDIPLGFELSIFSDSGILGDRQTTLARVTLTGRTSVRTRVSLIARGKQWQTTADGDGRFVFSNIPLQPGQNGLTAIAEQGSLRRQFKTQIRRVTSEKINPVLEWNGIALKTALLDRTPPPAIARNLAIVHTAVADAVSSITRSSRAYAIRLTPSTTASAEAAAIGAAYQTLVTLYPQQKRTLDQALARTLLPIPDGSSETQGLSLGQTVATLILETRRNDGATTQGTGNYQPGKAAGQWRPTPPNFRAAFLPLWGNVKPFAIAGADQFRLDQPPALNSRKYAQEVAQVRRLGELDSRVRRPQQTLSAQFWAGIGGPVYWNQLAAQIADRSRSSLAENARLFALLNLAEADAGITAWKIKYTDQRWRPIDAIRRAGTDGNGLTQPDRNWTPLLETPSHPDYVSAHSIFSSAAATILSSQWGDRVKFTTTSSSLPGVQRTYRSFQAAAQEAGMSRIYGGIHFMSANRAGLQSGRAIANTILQNFL